MSSVFLLTLAQRLFGSFDVEDNGDDNTDINVNVNVNANVNVIVISGVDYLPARAPGTPARHLRGPHAHAGVPLRRAKPGVAPSGAAEEVCARVEHPSGGGALCQQGAAGGVGSWCKV